jgi:hypothetical protein
MPQVYCIIPGEYAHLQRGHQRVIKVGRHMYEWLQRIKTYKDKSKILCVKYVNDERTTERILLDNFKSRYEIYTGHEYFWCEPIQALNLFDKITASHTEYNMRDPNAMDIDYDITFEPIHLPPPLPGPFPLKLRIYR